MVALNFNQKLASEKLDGNLLIIASAGTGKTTTIVERYINLIEKRKIHPEEILMTTFTNKAAKDMAEKILKKTDRISSYIGTMHSIFLRILRDNKKEAFGERDYTLLTEKNEQKKIIKEILTEIGIKPYSDSINYFLSWISKFKNRGIFSESLSWDGGVDEARESGRISELLDDEIVFVDASWRQKVNYVYKKYQEYLHKNRLMDFDEILMLTYNLFISNKRILERYKNQFKSIMVDEAQDLNFIQIQIINLLKNNNLCLIGDDCQNIYEWRGTSNDLIFDFKENEENIFLEDNYRSDQHIINAINRIISSMRHKVDKKLLPTKELKNDIQIKQFYSQNEEMDFVVSEIEDLISEGEKPENICVLFRTNLIGKMYEREFRKRQIPCHLAKTIDFFDREEIRDSISFLNLCVNPNSKPDFERIISLIKGLGKMKINKILKYKNENEIDFIEAIRNYEEFSFPLEISNNIKKLIESFDCEDKFRSFLNHFGYEDYISEKYKNEPERIDDKLENVDVLVKLYEENNRQILKFLDSLIEVERKEKTNDKVILSTIHGAKGLEWKHVYLISCNEGILPYYKDELSNSKRDSELRLFYVAISRAKDFLTITNSKFQGYKFLEPSQFLDIIS